MRSAEHPLSSLEATLVTLADEHGFTLTREPVKYYCVLEHAEHGVTVYLDRRRTPRNTIAVFIHPRTDLTGLRSVLGLEIPSEPRYSDGMSRFPKKINKGIRPNTYGYPVICADLTAFGRLLDHLPGASGNVLQAPCSR